MKYIGVSPGIIDFYEDSEGDQVHGETLHQIIKIVEAHPFGQESPHTVQSFYTPDANCGRLEENYIAKISNNGTCFIITDNLEYLKFLQCLEIAEIKQEICFKYIKK